jgi:hypothetical protein
VLLSPKTSEMAEIVSSLALPSGFGVGLDGVGVSTGYGIDLATQYRIFTVVICPCLNVRDLKKGTTMRIQRSKRLFIGVSAVLAAFTSIPTASADPVPQARRIDWTYTGVPGGIPNRTNICATFSPGATASAINSAITSCSSSGGGVVKLNAGTYSLTGIKVASSNVTLRGAGADKTILVGGDIVDLGSGYNTTVGIAITGGGAKDTSTFTVASTTGLKVNQMIEMDRDDDPNVVVSTIGGSRYMRQVNLITAISGTTITTKNPFIVDFNTGNPKIKFTFVNTSFSGIEDLKLDHSSAGSGTNFSWSYCYACWLKGVESYKPAGYHIVILGTLNLEVRDSFIDDAQTYGNDNGGLVLYGSPLYGSNSSGKIENNIFDRLGPAIEMQNSSSGFYIGYNYGYGSMAAATDGPVTWMYTDNHGPHDMMNLWEGNIDELFGSDGYFGGSSHGTVVRNYFTGYNPNFNSTGEPVRFNRLAYFYNLIGNVLGSTQLNPPKYASVGENCGGNCNGVFRLGYPNIGNASLTDVTGNAVPGGMTYPDAKVTSTLLRWGNYDYFHRSVQWNAAEIPSGTSVPTDQVIPTSYYYTSRPTWFTAGVPWPPIGPDVSGGNGDTSGHVNKIPAQLCWESSKLVSGGAFNSSACYTTGPAGTAPTAPTNLKITGQ